MYDPDFAPDAEDLKRTVELLLENLPKRAIARQPDVPIELPDSIPRTLPEAGRGTVRTLTDLAPLVIGASMPLDDPGSLAPMNPPTPWVTWATSLWTAALSQNLLHPELAPAAGPIETRVIHWLAPFFGMEGGHLVPGSTVATLTALWAAREVAGVREVVASEASHVSVRKSAHLLGLGYRAVPVNAEQEIVGHDLGDLSRSALVLTAGTTATGAIDDLGLASQHRAAWTHVDAAWAGPLRFTDRYRGLLDGIAAADSLGFSAHKWLFQPKESAVVLFREVEAAHASMTYRSEYLSAPNVGVLGSHGASAVPLMATLLSWGRDGLARRIERCMALAEELADLVSHEEELELWRPPTTGIVLWRKRDRDAHEVARQLDGVLLGAVRLGGESWLRSAVANPMADPARVVRAVLNSKEGRFAAVSRSGTTQRRRSGTDD